MARSRLLRACALLAITLSAFGVGCGSAPPPPAESPPVEIAPSAPASAAPTPEEPAKGAEAGSGTRGLQDAPKPAAGPRPKSLPGSPIHFGGGDGSSQDKAISILGAKGENDGVAAEYKYLEIVYGPRGGAWRLRQQSLLQGSGAAKGRKFDALEIDFGGQTQTFYFDITDYFGK